MTTVLPADAAGALQAAEAAPGRGAASVHPAVSRAHLRQERANSRAERELTVFRKLSIPDAQLASGEGILCFPRRSHAADKVRRAAGEAVGRDEAERGLQIPQHVAKNYCFFRSL